MFKDDGEIETIHVTESEHEGVITITPRQRFDISSRRKFREGYKDRTRPVTRFVVDLRETEYMDSYALAMMLLLHEHANANKGSVVIVNCRPKIKNQLMVANFDRLFEIK